MTTVYAFPRPVPNVMLPPDEAYEVAVSCAGMTLRDYFAGQALVSGVNKVEGLPDYELVALFGKDRVGITREEIAVRKAYALADAMLAERAK